MGIAPEHTDAPAPPKDHAKAAKTGAIIGVIVLVLIVLVFLSWWFIIRKTRYKDPSRGRGVVSQNIQLPIPRQKVSYFFNRSRKFGIGKGKGKAPAESGISTSNRNDIEMGNMDTSRSGEGASAPMIPMPSPASLSTFVNKIDPGKKSFKESRKRRSIPLPVKDPSTPKVEIERRRTGGEAGLGVSMPKSEEGWEDVDLGHPGSQGKGRQPVPNVPDRGRKPTLKMDTDNTKRKPDYTMGWN